MMVVFNLNGAILTLVVLMSIRCTNASSTTNNGLNSNGKSSLYVYLFQFQIQFYFISFLSFLVD